MPKAPIKFKMGDKPKPTPTKDKEGFSISLWAVGFFLLAIGIVAFSTVKSFGAYQDWRSSWDVVMFAKQNPDVVRVVKDRYDAGVQQVKEEITNPKE